MADHSARRNVLDDVAVVLGGDKGPAAGKFGDRAVCSAVTAVHLLHAALHCQCHQLMSQVDAQHRHAALHQGSNRFLCSVDCIFLLVVAGAQLLQTCAAAQNDCIRLGVQHLLFGAAGRNDRHAAASCHQSSDDVFANPIVYHGDVIFCIQLFKGEGFLVIDPCRHGFLMVFQLLGQLGDIACRVFSGNQRILHPAVAQLSGDGAGVQIKDGTDFFLLQIFVDPALAAEVGWLCAPFTHYPTLCSDAVVQVMLAVDAVVAGQRESFHNDIVGVCRVGQNLLIAYHAGVEHQLADGVLGTAQSIALIQRSVLKQQPRFLRVVKNIHTLKTSISFVLVFY